MSGAELWAWGGLFALGVFHGINPGMGWLFAVALGMQEQRRSAVWRSLLPLGLGHALAVAAVLVVAALLGVMVSRDALRWPVAAFLVMLGVYSLFRHCRAGRSGMRVGMGGLTLWSFLMATAHGAGLMVLPIFLGMGAPTVEAASACHASAAQATASPAAGILSALVHGAGYLLATALAAVVVYEKIGLGILRRAWFNFDLMWAFSLILTGALVVFV